jgi:hypothetical protein
MAAGDPGQTPRPDPATQSLRQTLLQAEDDAQRLRALEAIALRTIFAPTWSNSPEAVRTLTNSEGEHAMPLFSGLDTLQAAARRFGWMNGDGSLCYRELPAREVLRRARDQGVHYVVLDMFAEHATEFSCEEIGDVLARMPAPAASAARGAPPLAAARQAGATQAAGAASKERRQSKPPQRKSKRPPVALAEIDMPFARERAAKAIARVAIEPMAVAPRRGAVPRNDPRAEPAAPRGAVRAEPEALRAAQRAPARVPEPRPESAPLRERSEDALHARPAIGAVPVHASPARVDTAPVAPPRPAMLRAPSTLKEQPAPRPERGVLPTPGAFEAPALPQVPVARGQEPAPHPPAWSAAAEPMHASMPPALPGLDGASLPPADSSSTHDASFVCDDAPEPAANPAALEAAAMIAQVGKLAQDAGTQKAAADVAAMLKDMARKGVAEEAKPSAVQSAARMLAGMLSGEMAGAAQRAAKRGKPEPEPAPEAAAVTAEAPEVSGLRPLDPPMQVVVLDAIADALRKYPEVEWACEVSDGSETPVVGLRIDPAFQTRAVEIRAAVMSVAQGRKTRLSVLMLDNPQLVKEARTSGSAFFPWRKRAAKR